MKVKTSVSLSKELLCQIDEKIGPGGNRSDFIERVVKQHLRRRQQDEMFEREVTLLNEIARGEHGFERPDVLDYSLAPEDLGEPVELA